MTFGGIQKNSFIDYPGKIACVLFLSGCNFNCPYCHNPQLVGECRGASEHLTEDWVAQFLERRRNFLDAVVISGGEPTLQKDLGQLCETIKGQGFPVKIDTNGSRPQALQDLINHGLVDYIAMDVKTDPRHYPQAIQHDAHPEKIQESIRIVLESGLAHEFRTTCLKPFVDARAIKKIVQFIKGTQCYALQQFHVTSVLQPNFFQTRDLTYSVDELKQFQALAAPWVQKCIVR